MKKLKIKNEENTVGLFKVFFSLMGNNCSKSNSQNRHYYEKKSKLRHSLPPFYRDKKLENGRLMRNFAFAGLRVNNKNTDADCYGNAYQQRKCETVHYSPPSRIVPVIRKKIKTTKNKPTFHNLTFGESSGVIMANAKIILAQSCKVLDKFFRCSIVNFIQSILSRILSFVKDENKKLKIKNENVENGRCLPAIRLKRSRRAGGENFLFENRKQTARLRFSLKKKEVCYDKCKEEAA